MAHHTTAGIQSFDSSNIHNQAIMKPFRQITSVKYRDGRMIRGSKFQARNRETYNYFRPYQDYHVRLWYHEGPIGGDQIPRLVSPTSSASDFEVELIDVSLKKRRFEHQWLSDALCLLCSLPVRAWHQSPCPPCAFLHALLLRP